MDLKTIAPDSRTAVIERKEFKGGYNDGLRWGAGRHRRGRIGLDGCRLEGGIFGGRA